MLHGVCSAEARDRVWAEDGKRVLALDDAVGDMAHAARPERESSARRGTYEHDAHAGVVHQRRHQTRMVVLELLDAQPVVVTGEVHEPEVPGADDDELGLAADDRRLAIALDVHDAIG